MLLDLRISDAPARLPRAAASWLLLALALLVLDADEGHLLRVVLAEVDQHGRLLPGQVGQPGLVDRDLPIADRPRHAARLLVHRAGDRLSVVGQRVVEVAA